MVTYIKGENRVQFANLKGVEPDRFMQIERRGDYFSFRTSVDGLNWEDVPHSPVYRDDLAGKTLQVGVFQATYTDGKGAVTFDNFKLYTR